MFMQKGIYTLNKVKTDQQTDGQAVTKIRCCRLKKEKQTKRERDPERQMQRMSVSKKGREKCEDRKNTGREMRVDIKCHNVCV